METQIGQLAAFNMRREIGQLPSQPVANPRNQPPEFSPKAPLLPQPALPQPPPPAGPQFENAKAISTLRSGKTLKDPHKTKKVDGSFTQEIQEDSDSEEEEPMIMDKGKGKLEEKLV